VLLITLDGPGPGVYLMILIVTRNERFCPRTSIYLTHVRIPAPLPEVSAALRTAPCRITRGHPQMTLVTALSFIDFLDSINQIIHLSA